MKTLKDFICEYSTEDIENIRTSNLEQWLNDDKEVETKDKRQVIIKKIELSEYPNKIIGCVKMKDNLFDYEWNMKGECIKATDEMGNERKPEDKDYLYKKL